MGIIIGAFFRFKRSKNIFVQRGVFRIAEKSYLFFEPFSSALIKYRRSFSSLREVPTWILNEFSKLPTCFRIKIYGNVKLKP